MKRTFKLTISDLHVLRCLCVAFVCLALIFLLNRYLPGQIATMAVSLYLSCFSPLTSDKSRIHKCACTDELSNLNVHGDPVPVSAIFAVR